MKKVEQAKLTQSLYQVSEWKCNFEMFVVRNIGQEFNSQRLFILKRDVSKSVYVKGL